jgi:hypothetical protein
MVALTPEKRETVTAEQAGLTQKRSSLGGEKKEPLSAKKLTSKLLLCLDVTYENSSAFYPGPRRGQEGISYNVNLTTYNRLSIIRGNCGENWRG